MIAAPDPALTGLADQIAGIEATLKQRESELETMGQTLAARDATIAEMTAALATRDSELTQLRSELATLHERFAFDLQLAALKSDKLAALAPMDPDTASTPAPLDTDMPAVQPLTSIHFDRGSYSLTPGGQVHAAAAAVMLADMKIAQIRLVGFADRTGSDSSNRRLAEARARAVADFLVAQGVPSQMIETAGVIEGELPVPTGPGVAEPLNRSVSIVAVGLSA